MKTFQELLYRGRIRVQLKNDDGTPFDSAFPTRDSILYHLGSTIPNLKARQMKIGQTETTAASTSSSNTQKKGKGKRR